MAKTVKVSYKNLDSVIAGIDKSFQKITKNKQMYNEMGVFLSGRIKAQVRRGKPLNDNGKFPQLQDSSKRIRAALAKINQTHPNFKPNKSNLTFSGQLVDAIGFKVTARNILQILVKNSKRKPIKSFGNKKDRPPNNAQLDQQLRDIGFVMFTAKGVEKNDKVTKRLRNIALKFLRRALRVQKRLGS